MAEKYGSTENMTFKEKLEHYWTYYWKLALGICIVLVVVIAGVASILANPDYDTSVLLVTRGKELRQTTPLVTSLEAAIEKYAADTDGNGEVNVLCDVIAFPAGDPAAGGDNELAMQTRLTGELQLGDSQFFIFDKSMYDYLVELGGFMDLTALFPGRDIPLTYAIPLKETPLYDIEIPLPEEGLPTGQTMANYDQNNQAILEDLYLVFREDAGLKPERRAVQMELFKAIIDASK